MGWRFRIDLEYDGAGFSGWQIVPQRRTVQGVLERLLGRLGERARPKGAARTDAGVHALATTAHVDLERNWDPGDLERAMRSLVPGDIGIRRVSRVDEGFHARFSAVGRGYVYAFARERNVFFRDRRWTPGRIPPADWARRELSTLAGTVDAVSLARAEAEVDHHLCRIVRADWVEVEGGALMVISANRFLYGMVRTLAGTLVRGTREGCPEGHLAATLAARDRQAAGEAAPPGGLYLAAVGYGEDFGDAGSGLDDAIRTVPRIAGLTTRWTDRHPGADARAEEGR